MPAVKSLEELKRLKNEALQKREAARTSGRAQIVVAMGTTGIAAGARETMKAILETIEQENLSDVLVRQTGNVGLDSWEPIVEVILGEAPKVTYGKVSAERVRRIIKEHVMGGKVVAEYVIPA
jgi:NADP-reducing hydrogenase subunit HndB